MHTKVMIGSILGLLAFIMAVVGLMATGWYTIEDDFMGVEYKSSYGLYEVTSEAAGTEESMKYSDYPDEESKALNAAAATSYILILGLIFAILFFILAMVGAFGKLNAMNGMLPMVIGILAFVFLLIAAVYFAAAFPSGLEEDAEGVDPGGSLGGIFYVVIVGAILALIGAILAKVPVGMGGAPAMAAPGMAPAMPADQMGMPPQQPPMDPGAPPAMPP